MKTMITMILILLATSAAAFSQDLIVMKNGQRFTCDIQKEDSTKVYFTMQEGGVEVEKYINKNELKSYRYDSVYKALPIPTDIISLGVGFGLDYGGIGLNLMVYPQKNIGLFGGVGYAFAGIGYNAGFKLRFIATESKSIVVGYFTGMYGYNAALLVENASEYNKLFCGVTLGAGIDLRSKTKKGGYWSFAVLLPFRSSEVDAYLDDLETNYNVELKNDFLPVAFSIGYRIIIE